MTEELEEQVSATKEELEEWDPLDVRRLWCSVIQRAVDDCMLGATSTKVETLQLRKEAQEWLFSENEEFPSFMFLCDHLNLNPRLIREAVKNGKELQQRRAAASRSDHEFSVRSVHQDKEGSQESCGSLEGV